MGRSAADGNTSGDWAGVVAGILELREEDVFRKIAVPNAFVGEVGGKFHTMNKLFRCCLRRQEEVLPRFPPAQVPVKCLLVSTIPALCSAELSLLSAFRDVSCTAGQCCQWSAACVLAGLFLQS